jgi:hypothetical protein
MPEPKLIPTPAEEALIEAEFCTGGSCACDGALDDGCPACTERHRQPWLKAHRALEENVERVLEALRGKPALQRRVYERLREELSDPKAPPDRPAEEGWLLVCQDWNLRLTTSDTPAGYTLHLSMPDRDRFVGNVPEHHFPAGGARLVVVDEATFTFVFNRRDVGGAWMSKGLTKSPPSWDGRTEGIHQITG